MLSMGEARRRTFYRLTSGGRALWSKRDEEEVPEDCRRILELVESCGHKEVIRSRLARYPDDVIEGWLSEFEATNLIEAITAEPPKLEQIVRAATLSPDEEA